MADIELIKPRELPAITNAQPTDAVMLDNGVTVGKVTPEQLVNAGAAVASEAEALAGVNNTKRMTPLRVRQVLDNVNNPAVLRAQAWAESTTPPDPLLPDSKSAKTWASIAEQGVVMVQWSMIAADGQTVLGDDITTGEPIRAFGGVAQISVNGFGPITPEEYSVDSDGVVTLTSPLAEGDVVSGFTQPRLSNSEAQAVVQGVLQQTGADVAAAQEAADRAEANASLVKPQFDSVAQLQADTAMTDATVPVGGTVTAPEGSYVRVPSGGEITTLGGLEFSSLPFGGIIDFDTYAPDKTGSFDMSDLLQSAVDRAISLAASGLYNTVTIRVSAGRYKLNTQINKRSYITIESTGFVVFDFSGMSIATNEFCFRDWNDSSSPMSAAANRRVGLNGDAGGIEIIPANGMRSCLGIGNGSYDISTPYREVTPTRNVRINNGARFGVTIFDKNTYMVTFEKTKIGGTEAVIELGYTGNNQDSGEKIVFDDCVLVGFRTAAKMIKVTSGNWGVFITNSSIDFMYDSLINETDESVCFGIHLHIAECHIEKAMDKFIARFPNAAAQNSATIHDCLVFPRTDTADPPYGARPDGLAVANRYLFAGNFALAFDNNRIQGWERRFWDGRPDWGVFMCRSDVDVQSFHGNKQISWRQMISKNLIANRNHDFSIGLNGQDIWANPIDGWVVSNASNASLTLSSAQSWDGSPTSIRIASSGASPFATIASASIPICFNEYMSELITRMDGTTGSIACTYTVEILAKKEKPSKPVSGVFSGSGIVTVTTSTAHGLEVGDFVFMQGITEAGFNGWRRITALDTDFKFQFRVASSAATGTLTGTPSYTVERGGLTKVSEASITQAYSEFWNDTEYPLHTGNRDGWCRFAAKHVVGPTQRRYGGEYMRLVAFFSGMSATDTFYIGDAHIGATSV